MTQLNDVQMLQPMKSAVALGDAYRICRTLVDSLAPQAQEKLVKPKR